LTGLPEAVVRLGLRSVRDLVVIDCLPTRRGSASALQRQLWMHSVASALCCRAVGVLLRGPDPEWDFLAGLFHDVGRMHLHDLFPKVYEKFWESDLSDEGWLLAERSAFGIDHAEVGAAILTRWELATDLRDAVADHHRPACELSGTSLRVAAADEMTQCAGTQSAADLRLIDPDRTDSACAQLGLVGEPFAEFAARIQPMIVRELQIFASMP
jgi:putative nucleotidyltransferase with HDIG domain